MSADQKKKFFEVILLEKDYSKARLNFDLAGIQLSESLEDFLKSYYQSLDGYDPRMIEAPEFKLTDSLGDSWIDSLSEICKKEED